MVFMPHWPHITGRQPIKLGLERILLLLERLGNPQEKLPPVIHVAGTNGKGSTIAFMRAILEAAGYRVHMYTSPHLLHFNERIVLAGTMIEDGYLQQIMEECRHAAYNLPVTFFEGTTAGAFLAFSRIPADIVLLETGLGGRLDATNSITHPIVTVLTPISLDHTEYLGSDIATIAGEKVAITKRGAPCISSLQHSAAEAVIHKHTRNLGVTLYSYGEDWAVDKKENSMCYHSHSISMQLPLPNLYGDHQLLNAGTAIATLQHASTFTIDDDAIRYGITHAHWPARLQRIIPLPSFTAWPAGWQLWIDGAHNPAGAHILAQAFDDWGDVPIYLVCGITKGRDVTSILSFFCKKAAFLAGVTVQTEPSSYSGDHIAQCANQLGIPSAAFKDGEEAITFILDRFSHQPGYIICCGSLYLASDIMKCL